MGLIDSLFGSPLQKGIDQGLDFLYGGRPTAGPGGIAGPMAPSGMPDVGISETGALGGGSYNANDIVVEGFKPKKRSFLGFLADAYLMSKGGKPLFAERIDRKNVDKALRGYADNPLDAIRRLGQIHGRGLDAVKLYDQYSDNERASGTLDRQNRALDMKNDDYIYGMTAGAMARATPENWGSIRQRAIQRAQARGMDTEVMESIIPEQYDPDAIDFIRYGEIKPKDYERLQQQERRLGQHDRGLDIREEDMHTDNAQAATNEAGRNNRNAVNEAGRNQRNQVNEAGRMARKNGDGSKTIMTPGGRQFTISPSGLTGVVTEPDGTKHIVEKFGNGWKLRKK